MAADLKTKLLKSIGNVFEISENCQLADSIFKAVNADLVILADYLRVTHTQAFFLAHIFAINYKGDTVDISISKSRMISVFHKKQI